MAPVDHTIVGKQGHTKKELEQIRINDLKQKFAACELNEVLKRATVDALRDSRINFLRTDISHEDMRVVAILISLCKQLEVLNLRASKLNAELLEILNSGTKSSVKVNMIDVHGNEKMGEKGLQHLAEIVKKCDTKIIDLSQCELKSSELKAFSDALKNEVGELENAKIDKLIFGYNKNMGEVGYAAIGQIIASSGVHELVLTRCDPTESELQSLITSMGSAKVKKVEITKKDTHQKSDWTIPIDGICKLLLHVTEEFRMTGCRVEREDLTAIQQALKAGPCGLKVTIGSMNDYQTLEAKEDLQSSQETSTQLVDVPYAFDVDDYGSDSSEKMINVAEGDTISLHGCKLEVPPNSLKSDCTIKISLSNESPTVPKEYQTISPTLTFESKDAVLLTAINVEITAWCYKDESSDFDVILLSRHANDGAWHEDGRLELPDSETKAVTFPVSQLSGRADWVLAFQLNSLAKRILNYPIHTYICDRGDIESKSRYIVYFGIRDRFAMQRLEKHVKNKKFKKVVEWKKVFEAKINDVFRINTFPPADVKELNGFELTGVFMRSCFLPMEFELETPGDDIQLDILKNDFLAKSYRIAIAGKRRRTSQQAPEEAISTKKQRIEEESPVEDLPEFEGSEPTKSEIPSTSAAQSLTVDPSYQEMYTEGHGKEIGPDGGTITLKGFSIEIPPGALKTTTNFNFRTSLEQKPPSNFISISPVLLCKPDGIVFEKDVTVTAPCWCRTADMENPVTVSIFSKEMKDDRWKPIGTKMLGQDYEVTFTCRHFSDDVCAIESSDQIKATYRLEYLLFGDGEIFRSVVCSSDDTVKSQVRWMQQNDGNWPLFSGGDQIEASPQVEIAVGLQIKCKSNEYAIDPVEVQKFKVVDQKGEANEVSRVFSHMLKRTNEENKQSEKIILMFQVNDRTQFVKWRGQIKDPMIQRRSEGNVVVVENLTVGERLVEARYKVIENVQDSDWLQFARTELRLSDEDIDAIVAGEQNNKEKKYRMLKKWESKTKFDEEEQLRMLLQIRKTSQLVKAD